MKYNYGHNTFEVPQMSTHGVTLHPQPYTLNTSTYNQQTMADLHSSWDLKQFAQPRQPFEIGSIPEPAVFKEGSTRVLDMPIKLAGSNEYKIPDNLLPFVSLIQKIIDHEHSLLSSDQILKYNAYLTIDQSQVHAGTLQRNSGAHVDGFQGARIAPKTTINHSYVAANSTPTTFFPQAFNFSQLDERVHNIFLEMNVQANETKAFQTKPDTLYLMDAYTVHRAEPATEDCFRTFLRVSYDVKPFDRLGNTINPLLNYDWEMVPREAQTTLITYQAPTAEDKNIMESAPVSQLSQHIEQLRLNDLTHYYNFCYNVLNSPASPIACVNAVLFDLTHNDSIITVQTLRLLFIAALKTETGKNTLISYLEKAKLHIKDHLFLDFILEMITQEPNLLPKKIIKELISGMEGSPQGKEIVKRTLTELNPSSFWYTTPVADIMTVSPAVGFDHA